MKVVVNDRASWLRGPCATCSVVPERQVKPWRIILLGAPGVGKGTQAHLLSQALGTCHLSTGDVFRAARDCGREQLSPAMATAVACMQAGELVSDETVLEMIRERSGCLMCGGGFILDGFPRTVRQAEALENQLKAQGLALDAVVNFTMPLPQIVARLSGRRTCSACKAVYHLAHCPPKYPNMCDKCGHELFQREDDRPEAIKVRMAEYTEATQPLEVFYEMRGLLMSVPAEGTPEEIRDRALQMVMPELI